MIVDFSARYVSPLGRGMSSNSLRTALEDVAHAPRSSRASSGQRSFGSLMAPSLAGAPPHGKRIWLALRHPDEPREVRLDGARDLAELLRHQVLVEDQHHDGAAPLLPPPDVHRRDVDVLSSEDRADLADHARPVLIAEDQDVALARELDVEVAQTHDSRLTVEDGAGDDLAPTARVRRDGQHARVARGLRLSRDVDRSEEHTSELQSRLHLVCRLLLEKKKN